MPSWKSDQYLKFFEERTQPCRDLVARIGVAHVKRIMDLGCGPGNSTAVLAERWPNAELIGLDNSPEMIEAARKASSRHQWIIDNISAWAVNERTFFDIVFSNAALQWVPDHTTVFPLLLGRVVSGGVLALQLPGNFDELAHRLMRNIALSPAWRDRFVSGRVREWHVHDLPFYYDLLTPHASRVDVWETNYIHVFEKAEMIVEWYKGTGLRPFLDALATDQERNQFALDYLKEIQTAYPPRPDGRVLFPFRRLFVIAHKLASR